VAASTGFRAELRVPPTGPQPSRVRPEITAPTGPRWAHHPVFQAVFAVFLTVAGVALLVAGVASARTDGAALHAEVCPTGAVAPDCLERVPARVVDERSNKYGAYRYHLVPTADGGDDEWVRFPGDEREDPRLAGVLAGAPVHGLYLDHEAVAVEVRGERVPLSGSAPGEWRRTLLFSVFLLSLAVVSATYAWHRRDRPQAVGEPPPDPAMPLLGQVATVPMLGAFCAAWAERALTQVIVLVVVCVPWGWWVWRHRRAQRPAA